MAKKLRPMDMVAATGLSGNGKTTYLDLLSIVLGIKSSDGKTGRVEMSKVIAWGARLDSRLGEQIRGQRPMMDAGKFLTDDAAIPLLHEWLPFIQEKYPSLQKLLFGGLPRTPKQENETRSLFVRRAIADIEIDPNEALAGIIERHKRSHGPARSDDGGGEAVFNTRKGEFNNDTVPMFANLNGELIRLRRKDPPAARLNMTLTHLLRSAEPVFSRNLIKKALRRVKHPGHVVHREIGRILAGEPITQSLIHHLEF